MKNYLLLFCFFLFLGAVTAQEITIESTEEGYLIATDLRVNDEGNVKHERFTDSIKVTEFLRNRLDAANAEIAKNKIELQNLEEEDQKMRKAYREFTGEPYPRYVRESYGDKYVSRYILRFGKDKSVIQINKDLSVETISGGKLSGTAKIISESMFTLDDFFEKDTSVLFVFEDDTAVAEFADQKLFLRKTGTPPVRIRVRR